MLSLFQNWCIAKYLELLPCDYNTLSRHSKIKGCLHMGRFPKDGNFTCFVWRLKKKEYCIASLFYCVNQIFQLFWVISSLFCGKKNQVALVHIITYYLYCICIICYEPVIDIKGYKESREAGDGDHVQNTRVVDQHA